jgi:hypothetical protein
VGPEQRLPQWAVIGLSAGFDALKPSCHLGREEILEDKLMRT